MLKNIRIIVKEGPGVVVLRAPRLEVAIPRVQLEIAVHMHSVRMRMAGSTFKGVQEHEVHSLVVLPELVLPKGVLHYLLADGPLRHILLISNASQQYTALSQWAHHCIISVPSPHSLLNLHSTS